jgi:glycosyltransferase involved in cell wall biosynthesis
VSPVATVCIVTRNRRNEVLRAVASAVAQQGDVEILVLDDCSTDGTPEAIARAFPQVRLERFDRSQEVAYRRNQAAELASAPILVGIDDDSEFTTPSVVAQTISAFDDRRIGAVAIPLIDLPRDQSIRQVSPSGDGIYVTQQFMGAACALRRDAFLEAGGYRVVLEHQAEEPDLCIRLLANGYVVRLGSGDPVRHYGSPKRDVCQMWFRASRNEVLFGWHNVPMPDLLGYWAKAVPFQFWLGLGVRRLPLFAQGVAAGFATILRGRTRRPVSRSVYRLYRSMGKHEPVRLDQIEHALPTRGGSSPSSACISSA